MELIASIGASVAAETPAQLFAGSMAEMGVGLSAVGMIGQGQAASAAAKGQAAVAEYNAKVEQQQAAAEQQSSLYKQRKVAEEAQRRQSGLLAQAGASGAVPSEGSPLEIQAKQASESELDQLMLGYQTNTAMQQHYNQSTLDTMQAGIYNQQAGYASTAGMMGAGTSLLTGFSKIGKQLWS